MGETFALFQSLGNTPCSIDLLNRSAMGFDMLLISSFNIRGCISSGPQDLLMFILIISFLPSLEG